MNIRENLEILKEKLLNTNMEKQMYRLHFLNYHKIGSGYGMHNKYGVIDWPYQPFVLPDGIKEAEAFKILSYFTDYVENKFNLEPCCFKSVFALNKLIDLEGLGFKHLNVAVSGNEENLCDLFTVTGRVERFEQSEYSSKYFEWYTNDVSLSEVQQIYEKIGKKVPDFKTLERKLQR